MVVRVDETGRDHMACGVDALRAGDRILGDDDDLSVLDTDVPHRVEPALGVHDPAVQDHQVVVVRLSRCGCEAAEDPQQRDGYSS